MGVLYPIFYLKLSKQFAFKRQLTLQKAFRTEQGQIKVSHFKTFFQLGVKYQKLRNPFKYALKAFTFFTNTPLSQITVKLIP